LEAAVEAAALNVGLPTSKKHWEKADLAVQLHQNNGLPDVSQLLRDFNEGRKSAAYGDVEAPEMDAEELASEIEEFVEEVAKLIGEDE